MKKDIKPTAVVGVRCQVDDVRLRSISHYVGTPIGFDDIVEFITSDIANSKAAVA
ncbi:MAG: hypothetical protein AAF387_12335 [Pseudomonadota bacterium]